MESPDIKSSLPIQEPSPTTSNGQNSNVVDTTLTSTATKADGLFKSCISGISSGVSALGSAISAVGSGALRGTAGLLGTAVWIPYKLVKMAACTTMGKWNSGYAETKKSDDGTEIKATHAFFKMTGKAELAEEVVKFAPQSDEKKGEYEPQWVSCNYTRDEKKKDSTMKDLKSVIPNLAVHSLGVKETESSKDSPVSQSEPDCVKMTRSGAITNAKQPLVSLRGLQNLQSDRSEITTLEKGKIGERINIALKKIKKNSKTPEKDSQIVEANALLKANITDLQGQIEARRGWLGKQMIQLLQFQLEKGVGKIENGQFVSAGIGLVSKALKVDSGLVMSEEVMQEDMAAIYKEFNGFNVTFGEQVSVNYENKQLTIPKPKTLNNGIESFTLKTIYFNISTQDDQTNTGSQHEINKEAADNLRSLLTKELTQDQQYLLDKVKQDGAVLTDSDAKNLGIMMRDLLPNSAQNRNCVSGKDRTSIDTGDELKQVIEKKEDGWLPTITHGFNSVTNAVIEENTGLRGFKAKADATGRSWFTSIDIVSAGFWSWVYGKGGGKT